MFDGISSGRVFCSQRHFNGAPSATKVADTSRYRNDGVITAGATAPTWTRLPRGLWVLSFDGDNDRVVFPASKSLNLGKTTDKYTMKAWINTTVANGTIFYKTINPQPMRMDIASGTVKLYLYDGTNFPTAVGRSVANGAWHCIVGVVDRVAKLLIIYIDGVFSVQTVDTTAGNLQNPTSLYLGLKDDLTLDYSGLIGLPDVYSYRWDAAKAYSVFQKERPLFGV